MNRNEYDANLSLVARKNAGATIGANALQARKPIRASMPKQSLLSRLFPNRSK